MLPLRFKGFRICILEKIKIIGEKDYLYEKDYENNKLKDATLQTKLNYINNSLFHVLSHLNESGGGAGQSKKKKYFESH